MNRTTQLLHYFSRKPIAFAFVLIFAGIGASMIAFSRAEVLAELKLSPANGQPAIGSNFDVTVIADSGENVVNAVQADLTYDQENLQFISINASSSPFTIEAENSGGNGTVSLSRGTTSGLSGQQTVAVVTFKALKAGSTAVMFADTSKLLLRSDSSDILSTKSSATFTPADATPPSMPAGLAAGTRTATSIAISWTAATDDVSVAGYNIYRNGTKVGTSTGTSYTDTSLTPANTYNYTISAFDDAGNVSPQSGPVAIATTADTDAPEAPAGLTSPTQTSSTISLQWSAATDDVGVTGYRIYRNDAQIGTATTTSYTDTALAPNTTYTYTVAANDAAGNVSPRSTAAAVKTEEDTAAPSVPAGTSATIQSADTIKIQWNASTDDVAVAGYRIYRNDAQVGSTTGTTFVDTELTIGTEYSYTVAAFDAAGNLSAKSAASAVTLQYKEGDVNADTKVDIFDLSILLSNYNRNVAVTRASGDLNNDGVVNIYDLSNLLSNWGK